MPIGGIVRLAYSLLLSYRNDYIKIIERNRFVGISNTHFLRVAFLCQFSICKNIVYMFAYCLCIAVKKHSHLICTQPHCLIFQLYIKLYASVLRVVYFD